MNPGISWQWYLGTYLEKIKCSTQIGTETHFDPEISSYLVPRYLTCLIKLPGIATLHSLSAAHARNWGRNWQSNPPCLPAASLQIGSSPCKPVLNPRPSFLVADLLCYYYSLIITFHIHSCVFFQLTYYPSSKLRVLTLYSYYPSFNCIHRQSIISGPFRVKSAVLESLLPPSRIQSLHVSHHASLLNGSISSFPWTSASAAFSRYPLDYNINPPASLTNSRQANCTPFFTALSPTIVRAIIVSTLPAPLYANEE
ncbi:hypothetical protein F4776DRAFT_480539 [Hypoxylon sp. NC0597]|nr:hypothetical protein F4776DRAFT_480539 [Hypoxylon sp. NC0597]